MSLNIYLDTQRVESHPTFQAKGPTGEGMPHIFGDALYHDANGYRIHGSLGSSIQEHYLEMVSGASLYEEFDRHPSRTIGIYRLRKAEATLDNGVRTTGIGKNAVHYPCYKLQIRTTGPESIKTVSELYRRIRAGSISPAVSWEAEQVMGNPLSWLRRHLAWLPPILGWHGRPTA